MKYRNNPGNIRYAERNAWLGQIQPSNGFCQFSTMAAGLRALCITIDSYRCHHGLVSVESLISRYAPAIENDTESYIAFVCERCDCMPSESPFSSHSFFLKFVSAICFMETGYRLTPDDEAVVLARFTRSLSLRPFRPRNRISDVVR